MADTNFLDLVSALVALLGSLFGDGVAPLRDYVDEQRGRPFEQYKSVEEKRLERFWADYYSAQARYYDDLAKLDWVAYYKNHGMQINMGPNGSSRVHFAPMIVVPRLEPLVLRLPEGERPQSAETGAPRRVPEPPSVVRTSAPVEVGDLRPTGK